MAVDYNGMKRKCSANFTQDCVTYFLTLPRGDLGVIQSRSDFADDYCRDQKNLNTIPCNLLCRDDPATCLTNRRRWCEGVTLEMIEQGVRTECACYLQQSEYKRHIERIRSLLGDPVANELLSSINSPFCFYGPCASSEAGLASRTGKCQELKGCLQAVDVDVGNQKNVIVSNVCNIVTTNTPLPGGATPGGTPAVPPNPTPIPVVVNYSWVWWIVGIVVILLLIIVGFVIYRSRRKPTTLTPVQLAILSQYVK